METQRPRIAKTHLTKNKTGGVTEENSRRILSASTR